MPSSTRIACTALAFLMLLNLRGAPALSLRVGSDGMSLRNGQASCSMLTNHGTHFTVEVEVGTPGQKFDLVADTGSDNVIVASCVCTASGRCSAKDKCFTGTNRSSTFRMHRPRGSGWVLSFGSGEIQVVPVTDVVRVGTVTVTMPDAVLLMVDRALSFTGPFEGILGLGLPMALRDPAQASLPPGGPLPADDVGGAVVRERGAASIPRGFMEHAGIARFSICFNRNSPGALRLGTPAEPRALGSVGQFHWGLGLRGVSVGSGSVLLDFCRPSSSKAGEETPCGAIPDSGTTLMMGPSEHLELIYTALCDAWPRCRDAPERANYNRTSELFQVVLLGCEDWLESTGLDGLPPLHFHLFGAGGSSETITLNASSYVFMMTQDEMKYITKRIFGIFPVRVPVATGQKKKVCSPAFSSQEYNTLKNGPVWILGSPIFYHYQVGYDLQSTPPRVSFTQEPCGSCDGSAALVSSSGGSNAPLSRPWQMHGPLMVPNIDTRLPL